MGEDRPVRDYPELEGLGRLVDFSELNDDQRTLVRAARNATNYSYSPYSKFCVGAAIRGRQHEIITGVNIESASYGLTICAERSAIARAMAKATYQARAIAVAAHPRGMKEFAITVPCGACRQWIAELSDLSKLDLEVLLGEFNEEGGKVLVTSSKVLLPASFSPSNLGVDISYWQR